MYTISYNLAMSNSDFTAQLSLIFTVFTRNSSGDEIPKHDIAESTLLPLLRLMRQQRVPLGQSLKNFAWRSKNGEVQNVKEILRKVSTSRVRRTNVTDDRRICDNKDLNVT